jgi:ABC-type sugar transport system ATPase subunit
MQQILIKGLDKNFGAVRALTGFDLSVEAGENIVILGPSGSGKSTLLRLIAGLEEPDAGDILFDGQSQLNVPPHLRGVAMVFQNFALYPHLSAEQNIMLGLRHGLKLPKPEARARVLEVARTLGIEELLDRLPSEMSGGQRQRVALGRALARRAKIVLLDEPLSGLDAQLRQSLRVEISTLLHSINATAIFVTHDQLDATAIGDRIVVMREGRIEQIGTPEEIYTTPVNVFVAQFVGTPSINLVQGTVHAGRLHTGIFNEIESPGLPDGKVIVGIRPERLRPNNDGPIRTRGCILATELSGSEWILHTQVSEKTISLRCQLNARPHPDDVISLSTEKEYLLFFRIDDEKRINIG